MVKKTRYVALMIIGIACFCLIGGQVQAQQAYPAKAVQLVPAGQPGSSADLAARSIEQVMTAEKLLDKPFQILNKGAGGGNVMTAYMVEQKGNAYVIGINTNRVILNQLLGTIEYGLKDVTPVANLMCEYPVLAVRADSKYKSAKDVFADIKKDPGSVPVGVTSMVSSSTFSLWLALKEAGLDYTKAKVVALPAGGEIISQLLGGHIPLISTSMSEIMSQVDAGKMRILVIASEARHPRLKNVPTWKEQGINVVFPHWRAIWGPPDMPKVSYDYWNKKFAQLVKTKTWQDALVKYELEDSFQTGDVFKKQLDKDAVMYAEMIKSMNLTVKEEKK
jgi:putative tricarboxylic transport membrane protein